MKYETFTTHNELSSSSDDEAGYILSNVIKMSNPKRGYSVWTAAVFMMSFMAGMGVLALPHALAGTGWLGLLLVGLACLNSWYSALVLGKTWIILEERWEEYRDKFRYPYPAMGLRAVGPWMRYVVTITLHVSLIGVGVVYVLLAAQVIQSLTYTFLPLDYNLWIIILAAVLCPLTWFGSLEEFWFAALGALATACIFCSCLLAGIILEIPIAEPAAHNSATFSSFSLAFGTIIFSFGGTFVFPSIQNDMADRRQMDKASLLGFAGLLLLYIPVAVAGYAVYGSAVPANVMYSISQGYLRMFVEICLAAHVFLAFLLGINPVAQEMEELLGINSDFNYKRCLIRSGLVGLVLLIAYFVPRFEKIMNLIGGSTFTLLTFIFPPLFYFMVLTDYAQVNIYTTNMPLWEKLFLLQIVVTGAIGGMVCTYFAVGDIVEVFRDGSHAFTGNISISVI